MSFVTETIKSEDALMQALGLSGSPGMKGASVASDPLHAAASSMTPVLSVKGAI
jgi:hypothetical protein